MARRLEWKYNKYLLSPRHTSLFFGRARVTNTQLGQEENSAFTYLEVYGDDGANVAPEIIVAPQVIHRQLY